MVDKLQTVGLAIDTFNNKTTVNNVDFNYSEDYIEYKTLCGPNNTATLSYNGKSTCNITADTSKSLDLLYTIGIGSKVENLGVVTYSSTSNNTVLKVLEDLGVDSYQHNNMSVDSITLEYPIDSLSTTKVRLLGTDINPYVGTEVPNDTAVYPSIATRNCSVTLGGYVGNITNAVVNIENVYSTLECMSSDEFIGKLQIDKSIFGTITLDTSVKTLPNGVLTITSDTHGLNIPYIKVIKIREIVDDGLMYSEADFIVPDNLLSLYFN